MDAVYNKAMAYYHALRNERLYLPSKSCTNVAIEKYVGSLIIRFLEELCNESFESQYYPVYDTFDFYNVSDTKRKWGVFESGEYYQREDVDADMGILFDLLKCIFKEPYWMTDYFLADLAHIYDSFYIRECEDGSHKAVFDKELTHFGEDDEHGMKCFSLRSTKELLEDVNIIANFFEADDIDNPLMGAFWEHFRGLFNSSIQTYSAKYLLLKASHIPAFMALNMSRLSQEDRILCIELKSLISSLASITSSGWHLSITEPGLKASYFIYDLSEDHCDLGNDYLGICELPPDVYLVPYLLDNGIRYLDEKYHFLGGGTHDS